MGLFGIFDKKNKDKTNTAVGISISNSVRESSEQAAVKYSKPSYNPNTRKEYYDNGEMHKSVVNDAFANGKTYRDPYTGAELFAKQRDAKINYGPNWQSHSAEADHIDPLNNLVNRNKNNPFLTTDDLKEIGNSKDNYQVISRELNQSSKEIGKGGSTQSEWANDSTRMEGLEKRIESGESIESVKNRILKNGKEAEKRNDRRAFRKGIRNIGNTAHDAGKSAAKNSTITSLTISGIINTVDVIKGEKDCDEAITDLAKDGGKAAVFGYVTGGGTTVLNQILSYSKSEFLQALSKSNVPSKVITAVMATGDTIKQWCEGEITTQECLIQLGDKSLNIATMGYSMAVGQTIIPIPIVGGAVGALVGSILTSNLYSSMIEKLQNKELEHEERMRIISECNQAAENAKLFRKQLEEYLDLYFYEYRSCFNDALSSMQIAFQSGDANGVIAGANKITNKLGRQVKFETVDQFKSFMDSNEIDSF